MRERYWDPPRLRIDETFERTTAEASWREPDYTQYEIDTDHDDAGTEFIRDGGMVAEPGIQDAWMVVSAREPLVVPAGTMDTLHVRRVANSGAKIKEYWFARGIGKLREHEEGVGTEELISFRIAPP